MNPRNNALPSKPRRAVDWRARARKAQAFLWKHVVWSVAAFLGITWLATAALVLMAEKSAQGSNIGSFGDALWWGIVTFLTVGYGDKYPVTAAGREIAAVLMVAGVASTGIVTAKISSIFLEQALRDGRGSVDSAKLSGHFIVCGWNESMDELLTHILDFNRDMTATDLVVIANAPQTAIEALRSFPWLEDVRIVQGDHFSEANIRRAAPERARKVLILADRTPSSSGQPPTPTEIDARTIMAAMTISNIARGTLVTAEILDPKMDQYLKLANVTEIIYSSEYSRLLLGNATSGTGIANIVLDLLDSKSSAHITSAPFPEGAVGKAYSEAKLALEAAEPRLLVIGLLENSGNSHTMKEVALRRAQQTPDMAQLVANLRSVKDLRCNHPVFNPEPERIVVETSMAIVIAKRVRQGGTNKAAGGTEHVGGDQSHRAA
jgi:voltage-gated potassium channel